MLAFIAGVFTGVALSAITVMASIVWWDWRRGIEFDARDFED